MTDQKQRNNVVPFPVKRRPVPAQPAKESVVLEVMKILADAPAAPKARRKKAAPGQSIVGSNNTQVSHGLGSQVINGDNNTQHLSIHTTGSPKIEILPPARSIGDNSALRIRIDGLLKEIEQYRYERIGKTYKFGSLHGELATAFGLERKHWKNIWLWDEFRAAEVIAWLEVKRDRTRQGRIQKAAKGEGYQHTRGHLFRMEKDYLLQLGWNDDDDAVRAQRRLITGKLSRVDMNDNEFRNWVGYLRAELERMYGES